MADEQSVGALDPNEHTHLLVQTISGRDLMLECEPAEIERFLAQIHEPENLANGGAGLTITCKSGDVVDLIAGVDLVQRITRANIEAANEQARKAKEEQDARAHMLLSGQRRIIPTAGARR